MMLSMAGYVFNDAAMKSVLQEVNFHQAIFIRSGIAALLMLIAGWMFGAFKNGHLVVHTMRSRLVWFRTIAELGGTWFFITALMNSSLVNATAILQLLPLSVALAASVFLGEKVGWRRYLAIAIGFGGVLLIIKPGAEEFNVYSLYAVIATLCITVREIITRKFDDQVLSPVVSMFTAVAICLMGLVGMQFFPLDTISKGQAGLFCFAAVMVMVGYLCSVLAMRTGEISFVSGFRYSILIWALVLGIVIFGDIPDIWEIVGAIIIVASGLFVSAREARQKRH